MNSDIESKIEFLAVLEETQATLEQIVVRLHAALADSCGADTRGLDIISVCQAIIAAEKSARTAVALAKFKAAVPVGANVVSISNYVQH